MGLQIVKLPQLKTFLEQLKGIFAGKEQVEAIEQAGYQTASQVESAITGKGYQNASQVESIITGKGYQTSEQVESAITEKGYQTSEQVEAAITEKGYQTSEQVESAITGKGYQTAAQVAEAISGAGHLKRAIVESLPEVGSADENTVYMVLSDGAEGENIYEEWMVIEGVWERIGSTDVDLSGYLQETDMVEITDEEIDEILAT